MEAAITVLIAVAFVVWLALVVPYQMATRRNRRPWIWALISLLFSPILAILLLIALGNEPQNGPADV